VQALYRALDITDPIDFRKPEGAQSLGQYNRHHTHLVDHKDRTLGGNDHARLISDKLPLWALPLSTTSRTRA
jgi:hypothetical protein